MLELMRAQAMQRRMQRHVRKHRRAARQARHDTNDALVSLGARQTQLENAVAERDEAIRLAEARETTRIRTMFAAAR
jgi:Holliday junction resolvasome RuvABC DNA-binding subunit